MKYTAGPARGTSNGPSINVVVTLADGEEIKLWGDPGDPALTPLKKGQSVQLVKNARVQVISYWIHHQRPLQLPWSLSEVVSGRRSREGKKGGPRARE